MEEKRVKKDETLLCSTLKTISRNLKFEAEPWVEGKDMGWDPGNSYEIWCASLLLLALSKTISILLKEIWGYILQYF
jgi:hypothetical protein